MVLQKISQQIDEKKNQIFNLCASLNIKGLIILSREGINGTIAGEENRVDHKQDITH